VALAVVARQVPGRLRRVLHVIDYPGTIVPSLVATALILLTSLGGTTCLRVSAPIDILAAASVVLAGLIILAGRRATETIVPLHLFKLRTFSVTGVAGFIIGFTVFGTITYLPAFFQIIKGISPTISGVCLLPLMAGMNQLRRAARYAPVTGRLVPGPRLSARPAAAARTRGCRLATGAWPAVLTGPSLPVPTIAAESFTGGTIGPFGCAICL
jgi:hypothetical protein